MNISTYRKHREGRCFENRPTDLQAGQGEKLSSRHHAPVGGPSPRSLGVDGGVVDLDQSGSGKHNLVCVTWSWETMEG